MTETSVASVEVTRGRPVPKVNGDTEFFWAAAREHRLVAQRCSACGQLRHPPGPICPDCQSLEWESAELSGRGTLYSHVTVYQPLPPGFTEPPIVAIVALDEGIRLVSNVTGVDADDLVIGEPLEVYFVDQDEGWSAPQFRRPETGARSLLMKIQE